MPRTRPRGGATGLAAAISVTVAATTLSALGIPSAQADTPEMIPNGSFDAGTQGWVTSPQGTVRDGRLCVRVPARGAASVRTAAPFHEVKNDVYTLSFTASSTTARTIRVQTPDAPLDPNLDRTAALTPAPQHFSFTFSPANEAPAAYALFDLGGRSASASIVCLDDVSLTRIDRSGFRQDTGPAIKVDQVGYLPDGPKIATIVTDSAVARSWQLRDRSGKVVATGRTTPRGLDAASGQRVSTLDFSAYRTPGTGYTLNTWGGATSFPFDISATAYDPLRVDALQFFYLQRSGIAIDGDLVGQQYARAAGHPGDVSVPCQTAHDAVIAYGEPWGCDYRLNVSKGWYDAGDQGKYVVNGGIAVAQLMQEYERTLHQGDVQAGALADSTLRVPERGNGVPDVLDEARWELDFLLGMQVPQGSAPQLVDGAMVDVSGMAHHKMHDDQWTPLPTDPSQDTKRRELHRPSTAATLNLAAAAAQGARLFAPYDKAYSARLLTAARTAYAAAKAHPAIYAPGSDWDLGGGAYSDDDVTDEFDWAAAELYLTTGGAAYRHDVETSPLHASPDAFPAGGFSWASTAALGELDLATVPNALPDRAKVVANVVAAADRLVAVQATQAYGLPLTSYPWGSNSNDLNNTQVLATAYDLTGKPAYRSSALQGLDYVLGRNALAQSYVTGFGTKDSENQHSRLYAHELDPSVPHPPAGSLAGGANENPNDPPANDVLKGCAPQLCYVDDVNSYSTNEVAINWNSALSWVSSWAADQGHTG